MTYVSPDQQRRLHEGPSGEMGLRLIVREIAIATAPANIRQCCESEAERALTPPAVMKWQISTRNCEGHQTIHDVHIIMSVEVRRICNK